ncbi:hypothetical protein NNL21_28460 [Paenibacillus mendelii]|nr:hypothetical protein [Paenibacillus mendelii]
MPLNSTGTIMYGNVLLELFLFHRHDFLAGSGRKAAKKSLVNPAIDARSRLAAAR